MSTDRPSNLPTGKPLTDEVSGQLAGGISASALAALKLLLGGKEYAAHLTAAEHALLDQFFRQGIQERDRSVAEFVGSASAVHVPSPLHPIGNIASLSPLCADKAGRIYRYDAEAGELVLLLVPGGAS